MLKLIAMFFICCFPAFLSAGENFERKDLSLTVYNQNMALVRDVRAMEFEKGMNTVEFTDVASSIITESVLFKPLNPADSLTVLEQNYEYDLVNSQKLLQKYIDREIRIYTKDNNVYEGILSSFDGGQLVLVSARGQTHMVNRENVRNIEFPKLPEGLITKPTLVWIIDSGKNGKSDVELNYITDNIGWYSDYVANVSKKDNEISLNGWVTINNNSGASYENALVKLIAGDVRRERKMPRYDVMALRGKGIKEDAAQFKEKSFFEYHMYTLGRRTTIKNNQQKQISLLSAAAVPVKKTYEYKGATYSWYYYDDWKNKSCNKKVNVILEFKNSKNNNLGMPLPKGKIRVYKQDEDGTLQFIGEDSIDHTPKDEIVKLKIGNAFDVVGERKITNHSRVSANILTDSYEVVLRNHKKESVVVNVVEKQWGDWKILEKSHDYEKEDAFTVKFPVKVPANGKAVLTYSARYRF